MSSSIQRKMTILIFMCTLIPLLAHSILSYSKSANIVNEQLQDYNHYAMKQLVAVTNMHLKEMDALSRDIQGYLLALGKKISTNPKSYHEYLELNSFIDFLSFHVSPIVEGLFVITPKGDILGSRKVNSASLLENDWWTSPKNQQQVWQWSGFHSGGYYSSPQPNGPLISLVVPLHLQAAVPVGSRILVDVNAKTMTSLFRSFELDTKSYLEIRDMHGLLVYESRDKPTFSDNDYVFSETLELNSWTITARLPQSEINKSSGVIRNYGFLIGLFSLIVALIMARVLSGNFTGRIVSLHKSMLEFSRGKLDATVVVKGKDELSRLGARFNFMTEQIRSLIVNITRTEKLKNDAELRALHYQINPHLIINTLNAIQWRARMAGRSDIDRMIYHLAALLSENLDISHELVPLEEELETIGHYIKIQYYRYGDSFTYTKDIEPGIERAWIPRMTLQPLYENIFYHAFDDGVGSIALEVYRDRHQIVLSIYDDGKGIQSPSDVTRPSPPRKGRGGLGMYNVDQKIKLHFGEQYGIRIKPNDERGTIIEIRWPYQEGEKPSDEN
ncbi:cache domain-containing sensor histidine kinase [Paenibacillus luteus]|uniref:cache domain-containing sensor histidine kinase n=1 Tax=Paenibacillus luteus TaxID=2545753 RepID=UPI0011422821|nr:sensor histidine kinase [Paenibacillus luteus]